MWQLKSIFDYVPSNNMNAQCSHMNSHISQRALLLCHFGAASFGDAMGTPARSDDLECMDSIHTNS